MVLHTGNKQLLEYLSKGLRPTQIAKLLNIPRSTLHMRIWRMKARNNVKTDFQLGMLYEKQYRPSGQLPEAT
jgi:DNA-binding NarL/FixJ family response regulator